MAKKKNQHSPLLELSTDIERDFILIDGEQCPIKSRMEFSFTDYHWLQRRFKGIHKIYTQEEELTDEELGELSRTIDDFLEFIFVDTPKETINKLVDGQKMEIVTVFTNLFLENQPERVKKEIEKLTGEMTAESTEAISQ